MNQIKVFSYEGMNEVRTVLIKGEAWFVGKDVCSVLDIKNSRDAIKRLDDDEKGVVLTDTLGGTQNLQTINESGLYTLVLGSRKPEAKQFKRWITHEVIPSIRNHGAYMTPDTLEQAISNPDFLIGVLTELKSEQTKRVQAEKENAILQPKAQRYDEFLDSKGLTTLTVVGKHFLGGMTSQEVRKFLQSKEVIFKIKTDGTYPPKKGYEQYFRMVPYIKNGVLAGRTLKVNSAGIDFIIGLREKTVAS